VLIRLAPKSAHDETRHQLRTTERLRSVGSAATPLTESEPEQVRERIRTMTYGNGSNKGRATLLARAVNPEA